MADRKEILTRIQQADIQRTRYAAAYRALPHPDMDRAYPIVRGYLLDRFLLPEEMAAGDNILELADISLRHMLELKKKGMFRGDVSRACSSASSVIAKKVLLMKAVQEDFQVEMTPAQAAEITTVTELTAFILSQRS